MLNALILPQADSILNAAEGGGAGGNSLFMLLFMGLAIILLFVLPARRQKKMQQELKQRQDEMVPGSKVMTNYGLFGTIVEIDREENLALIEIAPGSVAKVLLSTITVILDDEPVANAATTTENKVESTENISDETSSAEYPVNRDNQAQ